MRRLLLTMFTVTLGCSRSTESAQPPGELIEFQLVGDAPDRSYSVAVAITPACDVGPIADKLAGLFHRALRACPDLAGATRAGATVNVEFALRGGKAEVSGAMTDPVQICVGKAIDGQPLVSPCDGPLSVQGRYRALRDASSTPRAAK